MKDNNAFYLMIVLFLVLLLGYLTYGITEPFFYPLAWAIVFAILFYPLYTVILSSLRRPSLAALLTVFASVLTIIVPALYLVVVLVRETGTLLSLVESGRFAELKDVLQHPFVRNILEQIGSVANMSQEQLVGAALQQISGLGRGLLGSIAKGIGSAITITLDFLIMAVALFFLLRDAPLFLGRMRRYLPFSEAQKDALMKRAGDIIFSTLYGGIVVALAQGAAGGIAFALLGLSTPVVWGFVIAVFSLMPIAGPGFVWGPAAVYLFIKGDVARGILLVVAGIGIAAIENFLRPLVVGSRTKMHFLVILFSVIGGIQFFGVIGFILGPVVVALFISVLDVLGGRDAAFPPA